MSKIIYTYTDEAPMLATHSLLPILRAFAKTADIEIETSDISLAGRILANFADHLPVNQQVPDALAELGALTADPQANIVKLPNISASLPQLKAAIAELQKKGYQIPDYPKQPKTEKEHAIRERYDRVKGSAVNPVLREGNSDRRAPFAVKNYARKHPHRMGDWSSHSQTRVATMGEHDFFANEQSVTFEHDDVLTVRYSDTEGKRQILRASIPVKAGEIFDATFMSVSNLDHFLDTQIQAARETNTLFSIHLKATMMKVSDPIIFGHVLRAYFASTFANYGDLLRERGLSGENGLRAIFQGLEEFEDQELAAKIRASFETDLTQGPALAMVDSDKGITNLDVPSDVIVDASMPAMIRNSGKMWDAQGQLRDTIAVIPDSSYAGVYQAVIDDCKQHGAFDPTTMGSVSNVGLMAKKAEEYGSHDKTFLVEGDGLIEVLNSNGDVVLSHTVCEGDIWRACQTKDEAVQNWVKLAVDRARISGTPAVFWLDAQRAHDEQVLKKVERALKDMDTEGLEIHILAPAEATRFSLERIRRGLDTISVTGNVLRDYNTDLFPILELGTSAKMLSVVPLLTGGGLYETGAGGSAPKHVQQLLEENHLRWDSLGEFLALAESFKQLAREGNTAAGVLAKTLEEATARFLEENKSPSRAVGEPDNRNSHFWLARFWADALAEQNEDTRLRERFAPLAARFEADGERIERELLAAQGSVADIGGYYRVDEVRANAVMRPSNTFNELITSL